MENNEENMRKVISELWQKKAQIENEIIRKKLEMIMDLIREDKNIPNFLKLSDTEIYILEDYLEGKALQEGKDSQEYVTTDENGRISIKIEDILLTLADQEVSHMTKDEFDKLCKTIEEEGGSLDNLTYSMLASVKKEEVHKGSEVKETIADRTLGGIEGVCNEFAEREQAQKDTSEGVNPEQPAGEEKDD